MKFTSEQVKKVAQLANLPLSDQETEEYSKQLSKIIDYIDTLDKAETKDALPTFNVTGLQNIFREDKPAESLSQEEALKNATQPKDGYFVTKGIFENE